MLLIVRGIQGSGKSTLAKQILSVAPAAHFEADMFFVDAQGKFNWDSDLSYAAHAWCFHSARIALAQGKHVIVSNTFPKRREIKKYLSLTDQAIVVRCMGEFQNIHGIPQELVEAKKAKMSDFPGEVLVKNNEEFIRWFVNERR